MFECVSSDYSALYIHSTIFSDLLSRVECIKGLPKSMFECANVHTKGIRTLSSRTHSNTKEFLLLFNDSYYHYCTIHLKSVPLYPGIAGNDYFTTIKLLLKLDLVLAHYWCRDKCVCTSLSSSNQSTSVRRDFP
jgi:hypothetical protein